MTVSEAINNAINKATLFHAAKRKRDQLYRAHTDAVVAAKTASDLWLAAGTEANRAEREWQEAHAALSGAILHQSDEAFTC